MDELTGDRFLKTESETSFFSTSNPPNSDKRGASTLIILTADKSSHSNSESKAGISIQEFKRFTIHAHASD